MNEKKKSIPEEPEDIDFIKEINEWIEFGITPLNNILLAIEDIEDNSAGLTKEGFFNNNGYRAGPLLDAVATIGSQIQILKDKYSPLLDRYNEVHWGKLIKLGKALDEDYFPFVFQIVWCFISSEVNALKNAILELMDLHETEMNLI